MNFVYHHHQVLPNDQGSFLVNNARFGCRRFFSPSSCSGVSYGVNFDGFMRARCIYRQWRPPMRERMAWSNGIQLWNPILFLPGCILDPSLEMLDQGNYTVDETPSYQHSMDCIERMFFWRPVMISTAAC